MPRPRLSYANVVSSLALFLALGGTSLRGHVAGTQQRRLRTDPRAAAVGSSEIKNGAVHLADLAKTTTKSLRGAQGPQGPAGPAGAPGAAATSYFAAVSGAGEFLRGNANGGGHTTNGSGTYTVGFPATCRTAPTPRHSEESTRPTSYPARSRSSMTAAKSAYRSTTPPVTPPTDHSTSWSSARRRSLSGLRPPDDDPIRVGAPRPSRRAERPARGESIRPTPGLSRSCSRRCSPRAEHSPRKSWSVPASRARSSAGPSASFSDFVAIYRRYSDL